jgi:hypothetical protein
MRGGLGWRAVAWRWMEAGPAVVLRVRQGKEDRGGTRSRPTPQLTPPHPPDWLKAAMALGGQGFGDLASRRGHWRGHWQGSGYCAAKPKVSAVGGTRALSCVVAFSPT